MEVTETLALVPKVVKSIQTIKETCDSLNAGFLPTNTKRKKELQQHIQELEEKIQSGFPVLASLVSSYGTVAADVKVAKALSDKNHEIIGLVNNPHFLTVFFVRIPGEMERDCTNVEKGINNLPEINNVELGHAKRLLISIKQDLDRLKQSIPTDLEGATEQEVKQSKETPRRLIGDIASKYSDLDGILTSLLKRILEKMGQIG